MPKERNINPAQAAHKADKAKALKKSKAEKHVRQNEKLARRNPERLQRQIDELKELETHGGLRPKDKQTLEQLERDLKGVKRAREALGDKAPTFAKRRDDNGGGDGGAGQRSSLGKRRRGGPGGDDDHSDQTDDEVRAIPMPRDTPPPIPRRQHHPRNNDNGRNNAADTSLPPKPVVQSQTVYSAAPVMRDLAKESRRFVPAVVAQNLARKKGDIGGGRLLEPEELDKLEKAGYGDAAGAAEEAVKEASFRMMNAEAEAGGSRGGAGGQEARLERELRQVEMEEVDDEDL